MRGRFVFDIVAVGANLNVVIRIRFEIAERIARLRRAESRRLILRRRGFDGVANRVRLRAGNRRPGNVDRARRRRGRRKRRARQLPDGRFIEVYRRFDPRPKLDFGPYKRLIERLDRGEEG